MNKESKLVREEKQLPGIDVSPLLLISLGRNEEQKRQGKQNKQYCNIFIWSWRKTRYKAKSTANSD